MLALWQPGQWGDWVNHQTPGASTCAVGMSIQDVKLLRRMVANAAYVAEEGVEGEGMAEGKPSRRSERIQGETPRKILRTNQGAR